MRLSELRTILDELAKIADRLDETDLNITVQVSNDAEPVRELKGVSRSFWVSKGATTITLHI